MQLYDAASAGVTPMRVSKLLEVGHAVLPGVLTEVKRTGSTALGLRVGMLQAVLTMQATLARRPRTPWSS
eukprot:6204682-Pleurochrysis_carterae.AAC.3